MKYKNICKRIIAPMIALVLMVTMIQIPVRAAESGEGWSFDNTTGKLTITSNSGAANWYLDMGNADLITSIEIEPTVTSVEEYAFYGCVNLLRVTIPSSVTYIANNVFELCVRLERITFLGDTPPMLGDNMFIYDNAFTVIVPPGQIDAYTTAFSGRLPGGSTINDKIQVTGVNLDKYELSFTSIGEEVTLTPTVLPYDATNKDIFWVSSDSDVVTVDAGGKVKAIARGDAFIEAITADGNFAAPCYVTVQPITVQITTQPQGGESATYGYTSAPTLSVTAETTPSATTGSEIFYQWYHNGTSIEGENGASYPVPTGLDAGTHSYYCAVTCDGYTVNTQNAEFTVTKATPTIEILEANTSHKVFGDTVSFAASVSGLNSEQPSGTLTLKEGITSIAATSLDYGYGLINWTNIPVGDHTITLEYTAASDGTGKNYTNVASSTITFTVAKGEQSLLSITEVTGKKYGDAAFELETTGGNGTGEVTYSVPENNGVLSISGSTATIIGAGTVTVTATKDMDNNYNSTTTTREITIEKADTIIELNPLYVDTYIYTGTELAVPGESDLAITGAFYSDVIFTWYKDSMEEINRLTGAPSAPGTYVVVASIADTANTNAASTSKTVSISLFSTEVAVLYNNSPIPDVWYNGDVRITPIGFTVSDSLSGTYGSNYILTGEGIVSKTLYFKQDGTGYITDGKNVTVNIDRTLPTFSGETNGITISDNHWKQLLNQITFGYFFKDTKTVSISATDSSSGVAKYYYYIDYAGSTTPKTAEELNALSFTEAVGGSFSISGENKYVIYAYVVDFAGNKSNYICTEGFVIDKTAPTVTLTAPTGSELGDRSVTAKVRMNETGTIAYVVKTSQQSGITVGDILEATDKATVSVADGQTDANLNVALSDLLANTTYYIYAVGTDRAENSGSVVNVSFTTTKTQPVFVSVPTITGTYGQQVKDMSVSQVASTNSVAGSWSISDSATAVPSVGASAAYDVIFTPEDAEQYGAVTVQVTPTVSPKSLTAQGVTIGEVPGTYVYDGIAKVPTVTVTDSTATMTASDYEYSYSNNTNAGTATATVTVTGEGNYTGTINRNFTIAKAPTPSITYPMASSITYGQRISTSTLTGGSTQYGTFSWTSGNTVPTVSNSGYEVTFTPSAQTVQNYETITGTTANVGITVSKVTPAVTVNPTIFGNAGSRKAILTGTVTGVGNGETPAGTIRFVNTTSGSDVDIPGATAVTITDGEAVFQWTGLVDQIYKVKAVYCGDDNYNTATSGERELDTRKQNQSALYIGSIGTKTDGDSGFILTTTGGSGTGAVTFTSSDPTIVSISGATATIHKAGTVTITAVKAEDSTYNEVITSTSLTIVNRPAPQGGSSNGHGTSTDTTQPDAGTPVIKDDSNKSGWEAIKEQIRQTKDGDIVTVEMNGSLTVPEEVLGSIRGTDMTLVFDMGDGITWSVNGQSITDDSLEDINLGVTMDTDAVPENLINQVAQEQGHRSISLSHNGEFGFNAVLSINMEKKNAGLYVNIFYYNPSSKELELQSIRKINESGYVDFTFTHASDYVAAISTEPMYGKALDQITISATKGNLYVGGTQNKTMNLKLDLPELPEEIAESDSSQLVITYQSSNPKVATVTDTGKIIAKKSGNTTITTLVTIGGVQKSFKTTIKVRKAYIKLTKSTSTLDKGDTFTFQAKGYGVNTEDIKFYTSKKSIVVINKTTGKAVAKSAGTDYVIAKAGNIEVKIKVEVK